MKLISLQSFKVLFNKTFCKLGIRQILILVFFVLSLLSVSAISWNVLKIVDEYNNAEKISDINIISQLALDLNNKLARERGFTATLIANRNIYNNETRRLLLDFRDDSDKALNALRIELKRHSEVNRSAVFLNKLNNISKRFYENREQADNYLNYKQDVINYKQWISSLSHRIEEIIELHDLFLAPVKEDEHLLQYSLLIKDSIFTLSENAGRERALISTIISQNRPFTRDEYDLLENYENTTQLSAKRLNKVLKYFPKTAAVIASQNRLKRVYLKDYQALRSDIIKRSQMNQKYPVNSINWFKQATEAVNVILALSDAINQQFNQDIDVIKSRVFATIRNLMITVFLVLSVFLISFLIIYFRILSPLNRLEYSASLISKGDFTHPIPVMVNDEFGKVAIAFEVMRDYLLKDKIRRQQTEQQLLKLSTAIEQSVSSIIITDVNGVTEYVNPQFYKTSGYNEKDVIGHKFNINQSGKTPKTVYEELWDTIKQGQVWQKELLNKKKNGELYWDMVSISPVRDSDGCISHYISIQHDMTEHKKLVDRLNYMAYHDELTALPNRFLLADRYKQLTLEADRAKHKVALLLLDLDQFKLINDNLGHPVGDQILIEVSNRLKSVIRDSETLARYGGDEFIILASSFLNIAAILELVKRINDVFLEVININGHQLHLSTSIGISIWPDDGKELSLIHI